MDTDTLTVDERLTHAERRLESETEERQRLERLVWKAYERDKAQLLAMLETGLLGYVDYEAACIATADRWEVALLGAPAEG